MTTADPPYRPAPPPGAPLVASPRPSLWSRLLAWWADPVRNREVYLEAEDDGDPRLFVHAINGPYTLRLTTPDSRAWLVRRLEDAAREGTNCLLLTRTGAVLVPARLVAPALELAHQIAAEHPR